MDDVKHTRGPWFVGAINDCLFIIDQPPRPSNDSVNPDRDVFVVAKLDYLSADANAHLIATAPDGFDLAKMVDAWGHGLRNHTAHEAKMVKSARALIAKATGGV